MASIKEQLLKVFRRRKYIQDDLQHNSDQFPGTSKNERKIEAIIGLDFGTAFTKVVVGVGNDRYAISFNKFSTKNEYLLPSILYLDENHDCHLGDKNQTEKKEDLKDDLILKEPEQLTTEKLYSIIFFLSLSLQHTRYQFMYENWDRFSERKIDWSLHIGMPAVSFSDEHKKVIELYKFMGTLAWEYSLNKDPLNYKTASDNPPNPKKSSINVNALAECDAMLLSYENSAYYAAGHHILIDIGAGTTDASYISIHEQAEDDRLTHTLYDKSVENFGSVMLLNFLSEKTQGDNKWDRIADFPDDDTLLVELNINNTKLETYKQEFLKRYHFQLDQLWGKAYDDHIRYNRLDKNRINTGEIKITYFVAGGGSNIDIYTKETEKFASEKKFPIEKMNYPELIQLRPTSIDEETSKRLTVAYGLSFSEHDFPRVQTDIEADQPEEVSGDFRNRYIGTEQT